MRWSKIERELKGQKIKIQGLENFQQELLRRDAWMNKAELYKAIRTIRHMLGSWHSGEHDHRSEAFMSSHKAQAQANARAIRNRLAHALDLKPCLLVVDEEPTLELAFDALFGLSSTEAKALYQFDKAQNFHVNTICQTMHSFGSLDWLIYLLAHIAYG
jgi:tRNA nucleotidyltransferase/poly(A) polymerase